VATRLRAAPLARLAALVALVRPLNLAAMALAAWVGARLGRAPVDVATIAVPVLIGAFGYARNDATDLEPDRRNRPGRPLPLGVLSPRAANAVAWTFLLAGMAVLGFFRRDAASVSIAAAAAALLAAYSPWLKNRGAAGPIAIALLTILAVVWGSLGGGAPERAFLPALLAGAAQFARECVKHLEDEPGDRAANRTTWAVRGGAATVTLAARLGILAALLLLPLPTTVGGLRPIYLFIAFPTAGLMFFWCVLALGRQAPAYGRVSTLLKLSLFCGLAALAIGS